MNLNPKLEEVYALSIHAIIFYYNLRYSANIK
jgi:hypothetical protein